MGRDIDKRKLVLARTSEVGEKLDFLPVMACLTGMLEKKIIALIKHSSSEANTVRMSLEDFPSLEQSLQC